MFETYFQLQRRPFSSIPTPDQYFPAASIEEARQAVVGIVDRQQGPALVIGGVGLGKSLLCQVVAESFRHRCRTVIFPSGRLCTRRALLQVILYEIGLPYRDQEESELRLSLIDHVTNVDLCPNGLLLLVDEADNLTMALLDELRSLTNLTSVGNAAVRVVLFGGPRLEERFAHPRLESFNQRLSGRFYLEPFTAEETAAYVTQQFADSGGDPEQVFTAEALKSIYKATEGIPRLINQLVDHALIMATANGAPEIDQPEVDEAWADLQQLPFPTHRRTDNTSSELPTDIIEFGQLSDDDADDGFELEAAEAKAESALDVISDQMDIIDVESESIDDGSTPPSNEPEVSLYFHEAHDPFGDDFEDEEVVLESFVSPDAMSQRHRRQVASEESAEIADQLTSQFPNLPCEPTDSETPTSWNVIGRDDNPADVDASSALPRSESNAADADEVQTNAEQAETVEEQAVVEPAESELRDEESHSANEASAAAAAEQAREDEPQVASTAEWQPPDADELANQGLHFEEFDLFPAPAEQPAEVEVVSFGPGVPEHAAGETDVDAAVPDVALSNEGDSNEGDSNEGDSSRRVADQADSNFDLQQAPAGTAELSETVASQSVSDDAHAAPNAIVDETIETPLPEPTEQPLEVGTSGSAAITDDAESDHETETALPNELLGTTAQPEPLAERSPSPASLSFRDALQSQADEPENEDVVAAEIAAEIDENPIVGSESPNELVDAAGPHEGVTVPEVIEAESKTTRSAAKSKRGSDYRRLFSQIRSKRR